MLLVVPEVVPSWMARAYWLLWRDDLSSCGLDSIPILARFMLLFVFAHTDVRCCTYRWFATSPMILRSETTSCATHICKAGSVNCLICAPGMAVRGWGIELSMGSIAMDVSRALLRALITHLRGIGLLHLHACSSRNC